MNLLKKLHTFMHFSRHMGVGQTARLYISRAAKIPWIELHVRGIASSLRCRTGDSDHRILNQVFFEHDCDVDLSPSPKLLIDAGANVGFVSVYYANKYPDACIIAIEPDDANLEIARYNCRTFPNVRFIKAGVWISNTPLKIANPGAESDALQVIPLDGDGGTAIQGVTIDKLLEESGFDLIDYLKLDIEGAEGVLFADPAYKRWIARVRIMAVEAHGSAIATTIIDAMSNVNFDQTQMGEKLVFYNRDLNPVTAMIK